MRLPLTLLLTLPATASASPTSIFTVAGHAAGTFGQLAMPDWAPSGGAAWSADGREIHTLDTTGALHRWRAADAAPLEERTLRAPEAAGASATLHLTGTHGASLTVEVRTHRPNGPARARYLINPTSGRAVLNDPCPASRRTLQVCTPDGASRARVEGGAVLKVTGGRTVRLPIPDGLRPVTLALSDDGERTALLTIKPQDERDGHGIGTLLVWRGATLRRVPLGTSVLDASLASLHWAGKGLLRAVNVYDRQTGGVLGGQVLAYHREDGTHVWSLPPTVRLRGVRPSPDGQLFVTIRGGSVPEVRRVRDGRFLRGLGEALIAAVPLTGQRALVALQGGGGGGRVALLSRDGLRTVSRTNATALAASSAGRFATAAGTRLQLHDREGRVERRWTTAAPVQELAFSPEGNFLSARTWDPQSGQTGVQAWRVNGPSLRVPTGALVPVASLVLSTASDNGGPSGAYRERLTAGDLQGRTLWRTGWHRGGFDALLSADGRWVAMGSQAPGARRDPVDMEFRRLNTTTGQQGPVLRLSPSTTDPLSVRGITALSVDGRLALLREGSGDACGWALYNFALADLRAGKALPIPTALAKGFARQGGCGRDVPVPAAAFAPDDRLMVQDGNALTWWQVRR